MTASSRVVVVLCLSAVTFALLACSQRSGPGAGAIDAGARATSDGGAGADAGRRPDADAGVPSFECDPIQTGIFVIGNQIDRPSVPRLLGSYDPRSSTFTELADLRSCIEGYYVRGMTVSRDGIAYVLLANQTIAAYRIETGACDVHPLARSTDDGLYTVTTFLGNGSGSMSPADERLLVAFRGYGDADPVSLVELDRTTFVETPRTVLDFGSTQLVSLAGTSDGRLFASRGTFASDVTERDVVQIDLAGATTNVVARAPARTGTWLRTAVALWDSQLFVFDATAGATLTTTVSAVDPGAGTWGDVLLTLDQFEVQAVSTTTCVGVNLI